MDKKNNFQYWIWFGFVLTMIPIAFSVWKSYGVSADDKELLVVIKNAISNGELMLVSLSLLGANLGELFKKECKKKSIGFLFIGISFTLCLFAISAFGEISVNKDLDEDYAFKSSLLLFILTVIICVISIFIPKKED